jgi:(E)-4-hydroxy-3-methylbut-2-enyl-diphosphate synthase
MNQQIRTMSQESLYCEDLFNYHRNPTRKVKVGTKNIGGISPIQIQSMTTTNSLDAEATAQQVMSICDAGADIVRITTQGRSEAHTLADVKKSFAIKVTSNHWLLISILIRMPPK